MKTSRRLVTRAAQKKVRAKSVRGPKPWLKLAGKLRHLQAENLRISRLVEEEFEQIEPEKWAGLSTPDAFHGR